MVHFFNMENEFYLRIRQTLFGVFFSFLFAISVTGVSVMDAWCAELHIFTEVTGTASFYDDNETLTGSAVEMVRELLRRTGDSGQISVVPWARGYDALLCDRDVVLFPTTRTQLRDPLFHWIGPIIRLQWRLICQKDSHLVINSLEDARKVGAIGTYLGDVREQFLLDKGFTNLKSTPANDLNYKKLMQGRVDLVFTASYGYDETLERIGLSRDAFRVAYIVREMDLYVAMSKKTDPLVVKRWQRAFADMKADGTFQTMYRKWNPGAEPPMDVRQP